MTGRVIWITGLSGAGKTTLATLVTEGLRARGVAVLMLDGDALRGVFGAASVNPHNHGREGRLALAMQYARLCQLIALQETTVVIATISLFREIHMWNRANLPEYFEVYLKVPLYELQRRDPKGIYRRYLAGETKDVAGFDLPIDEPEAADLVLDFQPQRDAAMLASELISILDLRKPQ
jgi:adenylylsulfate kinase-like enzyme